MTAAFIAPVEALGLEPESFFDAASIRLAAGARAVTFYGQPAGDPAALTLTLVLDLDGRLEALRTEVERARGFHSLTLAYPALHALERELHEQHGVMPHFHPWLKPLRSPSPGPGGLAGYPFYKLSGKEVHEVAVGPIHAGVIEPGHFRFMCEGERVHHLEIQLGYQHRGVEALLRRGDPRRLTPLVETIAGDASVAHAWAFADALEALAGVEPSPEVEGTRGVGLELERIAMHLAGLSGLANDIAFLQGAATWGRLRTTAINTTMLACGSRFGRGWVRPGEARAALGGDVGPSIRAALDLLERDGAIVEDRFLASTSACDRLEGVGTLTRDQALSLGLVGLPARASGVALDLRSSSPEPLYRRLPVEPVVEHGGDAMARALVRMRELRTSIGWIRSALDGAPTMARAATPLGPLAPRTLAIGLREGWRGEVVHALETGADGTLCSYKVQDPSLRNWYGLALAVRGNEISDFPVCNKSFDLSYAGHDL